MNRPNRYARGTMVTDRSRGGQVSTSLTADELQSLDAIARQRDLSRCEALRIAIREYIATQWSQP